jgi:hypothetical protein
MKLGVVCSLGGDDRKVEEIIRRERMDVSKRFSVPQAASEKECDMALNNALNHCKESKYVTHLIISLPKFPTEITNAPYSSGLGDFLETGELPKTLLNTTLYLPTYSPHYLTDEQRRKVKAHLESLGFTVIFT